MINFHNNHKYEFNRKNILILPKSNSINISQSHTTKKIMRCQLPKRADQNDTKSFGQKHTERKNDTQ